MKHLYFFKSICLFLCAALLFACSGCSLLPNAEKTGLFSDYTIPDPERNFLRYDVVVVGAGIAGLTAALTAAEAGARVAVIEKMPTIGGNSLYSSGTFNSLDPVRQEAQGIEDSLELFLKQTYEGGGEAGNPDLIALLCENSASARDWLENRGVVWSKRGVYLSAGGAWPRSLDAADGAFQSLILPLAKALSAAGGEIIRDYRALALIRDSGRIVGVRAAQTETGEQHSFFVTGGVILATGGFGSNEEMIRQYCADIPEQAEPETTPAATGDGILMALRVGAALVDMEYVQMVPGAAKNCIYFSSEIDSVIYVNAAGKRFTSEQLSNNELCKAILEQPGGVAYAIFDSSTIGEDFTDMAGRNLADIRALSEEGLCGYGEDLTALAENLGIDAQALCDTVAEFNRIADGQAADPFGREFFSRKLGNGPFYASIRTARIHYTMGGLKINTSAQVLNESGDVIPGLYACGEVTGGIHGKNHVSGNALADCVVFGRIAGKSALPQE